MLSPQRRGIGTAILEEMPQIWNGSHPNVGAIRERIVLADVIVVDGDPLEDITAIRNVPFVMLNGKIEKNEL